MPAPFRLLGGNLAATSPYNIADTAASAEGVGATLAIKMRDQKTKSHHFCTQSSTVPCSSTVFTMVSVKVSTHFMLF